jgi:signal transduction histidine kinase
VKYSGERRFEVELRGTSESVYLTVRDFGIGFDPEIPMKGLGLGLISMRERLKLVHGELSIHAQPGRGTTIHACVPVALNNSSTQTAAAAG